MTYTNSTIIYIFDCSVEHIMLCSNIIILAYVCDYFSYCSKGFGSYINYLFNYFISNSVIVIWKSTYFQVPVINEWRRRPHFSSFQCSFITLGCCHFTHTHSCSFPALSCTLPQQQQLRQDLVCPFNAGAVWSLMPLRCPPRRSRATVPFFSRSKYQDNA